MGEKIEALKQNVKDTEQLMRIKAASVGNIVGKSVPVSMTEVRLK